MSLVRRVTGRPLLVAALVGALVGMVPLDHAGPALASTTATLDPLLQQALLTTPPSTTLTVIAELTGPATAGDVTAIQALGAGVEPFSTLPMAAVQATPTQITSLAALPDIQSLWLNHPVELALHESIPQIGADQVRKPTALGGLGVTGAGVGVAVLDSGIDGNHPDLHYPDHVVQNVKILGDTRLPVAPTAPDPVAVAQAVPNVTDTDTTSGHGTHVAGIVGGSGTASGGYYTGVAPGAHIVGVGAGDGEDMFSTLAGYDWILSNYQVYGIRVINDSWADDTDPYSPADPLNVASKQAHDDGITVVAAAGNDGPGSGGVNASPAGYNIYAQPPWVIGVAAMDKTGAWASYSSVGTATVHPDITAPGSWIASSRAITGVVTDANSTPLDATDPANPRLVSTANDPYYTVATGTSMATPHVTGTVALMLQADPFLTPDQVKADLVASASPMAGCSPSACGAGALNALGAVQAATGQFAAPPVATLAATPTAGAAPLSVTLDATGSSDPNGRAIVAYKWDFDGDGVIDATSSSPLMTESYGPGTFHPTVVAVDSAGLSSAPAPGPAIAVANPPNASASVPGRAKSGAAVTFDASGSSQPPPGMIVSYRFSFGDGSSVASAAALVSHTYTVAQPTLFAWTLVVVNNAGVTGQVQGTIKITP